MPEETLSQETASFIRDRRHAIGMSQDKLAELACGSKNMRSYISAIENGRREIKLSTLENILIALETEAVFTSQSGVEISGCSQNNAAEFIRTQRLHSGLSQGKLSVLVFGDISYKGRISKIESGKKNLTITSLGHILKALKSKIKYVE
jgi:transcriptional regulator with XRE-family HTH domain